MKQILFLLFLFPLVSKGQTIDTIAQKGYKCTDSLQADSLNHSLNLYLSIGLVQGNTVTYTYPERDIYNGWFIPYDTTVKNFMKREPDSVYIKVVIPEMK